MDRYVLYECVGRGSHLSTVVWKGRQKSKLSFYSLKSYPKKYKETVMTIVNYLYSLHHPNVLKFIEWYETNGHLWVVEEFCASGTMREILLQDGKIPENSLQFYSYDLLSLMGYCHSNGILLRLFSPKTFLFNDFGILKCHHFEYAVKFPQNDSDVKDILSSTCQLSPYYSPPEFFLSNPIPSTASDIWSMAAIIWELSTGYPPFYAEDLFSLRHKILFSPLEFSSALSDDFNDLMSKMLRKDPKERMEWEDILQHPWVTQILRNETHGNGNGNETYSIPSDSPSLLALPLPLPRPSFSLLVSKIPSQPYHPKSHSVSIPKNSKNMPNISSSPLIPLTSLDERIDIQKFSFSDKEKGNRKGETRPLNPNKTHSQQEVEIDHDNDNEIEVEADVTGGETDDIEIVSENSLSHSSEKKIKNKNEISSSSLMDSAEHAYEMEIQQMEEEEKKEKEKEQEREMENNNNDNHNNSSFLSSSSSSSFSNSPLTFPSQFSLSTLPLHSNGFVYHRSELGSIDEDELALEELQSAKTKRNLNSELQENSPTQQKHSISPSTPKTKNSSSPSPSPSRTHDKILSAKTSSPLTSSSSPSPDRRIGDSKKTESPIPLHRNPSLTSTMTHISYHPFHYDNSTMTSPPPALSLLFHPNDVNISPIAGNISIEKFLPPHPPSSYKIPSNIFSSLLSPSAVSLLSKEEMEKYLSNLYSTLCLSNQKVFESDGKESENENNILLNFSLYFYVFSVIEKFDSISTHIVNSQIFTQMVKMIKYYRNIPIKIPKNSNSNSPSATSPPPVSLSIIILMLHIISFLFRSSTFLSKSVFDTQIINILNDIYQSPIVSEKSSRTSMPPSSFLSSLSVLLRRRVLCCFCEFLFYVSTEEGENHHKYSQIVKENILPIFTSVLQRAADSEDNDDIMTHYVLKTIHNVCSSAATTIAASSDDSSPLLWFHEKHFFVSIWKTYAQISSRVNDHSPPSPLLLTSISSLSVLIIKLSILQSQKYLPLTLTSFFHSVNINGVLFSLTREMNNGRGGEGIHMSCAIHLVNIVNASIIMGIPNVVHHILYDNESNQKKKKINSAHHSHQHQNHPDDEETNDPNAFESLIHRFLLGIGKDISSMAPNDTKGNENDFSLLHRIPTELSCIFRSKILFTLSLILSDIVNTDKTAQYHSPRSASSHSSFPLHMELLNKFIDITTTTASSSSPSHREKLPISLWHLMDKFVSDRDVMTSSSSSPLSSQYYHHLIDTTCYNFVCKFVPHVATFILTTLASPSISSPSSSSSSLSLLFHYFDFWAFCYHCYSNGHWFRDILLNVPVASQSIQMIISVLCDSFHFVEKSVLSHDEKSLHRMLSHCLVCAEWMDLMWEKKIFLDCQKIREGWDEVMRAYFLMVNGTLGIIVMGNVKTLATKGKVKERERERESEGDVEVESPSSSSPTSLLNDLSINILLLSLKGLSLMMQMSIEENENKDTELMEIMKSSLFSPHSKQWITLIFSLLTHSPTLPSPIPLYAIRIIHHMMKILSLNLHGNGHVSAKESKGNSHEKDKDKGKGKGKANGILKDILGIVKNHSKILSEMPSSSSSSSSSLSSSSPSSLLCEDIAQFTQIISQFLKSETKI